VIELVASCIAVILLDQSSKRVVAPHVNWQFTWSPSVRLHSIVARKRFYANPAVRLALCILWVVALSAAARLHTSGLAFQNLAAVTGLGAALGGAAGNLLDIVRNQGVTDFISVGWWPSFNLADVAILAGLTLAFCPS